MFRFACLIFLILCHYGYGYETKGEIEAGIPIQNASSFIVSPTTTNKTTDANLTTDPAILINNSSYHEELQSFVKNVVAKVKGGFNKVKTKVNVGVGKIKSKVTDIRNKIGGGGGDSGSTYYRRPYIPHGRITSSGGEGEGGGIEPTTVLWVLLGLGVAGVMGTILYFVIKK